jgi:hypothetical protein
VYTSFRREGIEQGAKLTREGGERENWSVDD